MQFDQILFLMFSQKTELRSVQRDRRRCPSFADSVAGSLMNRNWQILITLSSNGRRWLGDFRNFTWRHHTNCVLFGFIRWFTSKHGYGQTAGNALSNPRCTSAGMPILNPQVMKFGCFTVPTHRVSKRKLTG